MPDNWITDTRHRLAQRCAKKPETKSGQIWALWPEIKSALEHGQSFRSLCSWLNEEAGMALSVPALRSYVSRSRRKEVALRRAEAQEAFLRAAVSIEQPPVSRGQPVQPKALHEKFIAESRQETEQQAGPLTGALRALRKARRLDLRDIHGDGDPSGKNLI